jgi:hypothetical protein
MRPAPAACRYAKEEEMASHPTATADLDLSQAVTRTGRRVDGVIVAFLVAALFAALSAAYFGVKAGTDFPEPWAQMSD